MRALTLIVFIAGVITCFALENYRLQKYPQKHPQKHSYSTGLPLRSAGRGLTLYTLSGEYKGDYEGLVSIAARFGLGKNSTIKAGVFGQSIVCKQSYEMIQDEILFNSSCLSNSLKRFGENYPITTFSPVKNTIRVLDSSSYPEYDFFLLHQ